MAVEAEELEGNNLVFFGIIIQGVRIEEKGRLRTFYSRRRAGQEHFLDLGGIHSARGREVVLSRTGGLGASKGHVLGRGEMSRGI